MVGDAEVTDIEYNHLIDFCLRRPVSDYKVLRQSYIIHTTTLEAYRARVLELRIFINDVAASFPYPVYICKRITEIPKDETEQ